jgi:selenide,water dikinase
MTYEVNVCERDDAAGQYKPCQVLGNLLGFKRGRAAFGRRGELATIMKPQGREASMAATVRLTSTAKAAGCAAKMNPALLESLLRELPRQSDPNVLVGFETNDDAGVYRIAEGLAMVQTVDFFPPIVDDPYTFGQIAAANALSDVYAMGGKPVSALSLVGFPEKADTQIAADILRGGLAKMMEAKCAVLGGHSIRSEEIIFGYAVTGVLDPLRIWRNVGARANDVLIFTKPLGTGVITTALKREQAAADSLAAAVASMTTLNRAATAALRELESQPDGTTAVRAVTDVTGFGLLGHAREMALGDAARGIPSTSFEIDHRAFAYLLGAEEATRAGHLSGGLKNNRAFVGDCVQFAGSVPQEFQDLLFDPQTSGGLLAAIAPKHEAAAIAALVRQGVDAHVVGRVVEKRSPLLAVH